MPRAKLNSINSRQIDNSSDDDQEKNDESFQSSSADEDEKHSNSVDMSDDDSSANDESRSISDDSHNSGDEGVQLPKKSNKPSNNAKPTPSQPTKPSVDPINLSELTEKAQATVHQHISKYVKDSKIRIKRKLIRKIKQTKEELEKLQRNTEYDSVIVKLTGDLEVLDSLDQSKLREIAENYHFNKASDALTKAKLPDYSENQRTFIQQLIQNNYLVQKMADLGKKLLNQKRRKKEKLDKVHKLAEKKQKRKLQEQRNKQRQQTSKKPPGDNASDSENEEKINGNEEKSVDKKAKEPKTQLKALKVGTIIDGVVNGVVDYGVYVDFFHAHKSQKGLIHISEVSNDFVRNVRDRFTPGDKLQACVVKISPKDGKISLSLKQQYFPHNSGPKIQHLAANLGPKKGPNMPNLSESVFVDSLQGAQRGERGEDSRVSSMKTFLQLSKGVKAGKNRLGQRERRKLNEQVFGQEAKHKMARNTTPSTKNKRRREEGEEKNDAGRSYAQKNHEETPQNQEGTGKSQRRNDSNKVVAVDSSLHPSWQAKEKQRQLAALAFSSRPAAKKVKLDD
jgi:predicted RNA-binding protein with RPS1 domain